MMRILFSGFLAALLALIHSCQVASAQTTNINYANRGWYNELGTHDSTNPNYIVGDEPSVVRPD